MNERPVQRPDCRAIGARPARLAAWPASREPSSGIAISKTKAVRVDTPGMLIRMAKRSARLASASTIWRIAASTVAICRWDLFEALSILTLQQREGQNFTAVLGGGAILHQGLASDVKLLHGLGAPPIPARRPMRARVAASRRSVGVVKVTGLPTHWTTHPRASDAYAPSARNPANASKRL